MKQKIPLLLVAFSFPPFNSIGARRWAKMAKYLAKDGHSIYVICSENPYKSKGNWVSDIQQDGIFVTQLKYNYPKILNNNSNNFFRKIFKKIGLIYYSWMAKGNLSDESLFWKNQFFKEASRLIVHNEISHVICTSPPFHISYFTCQLRNTFPNIRILCDFRDVWLDGKVFGLNAFTKRVYNYESKLEKHVLKTANILTFTDSRIIENLQRKNPEVDPNKFVLLPHAFDPEDYIGLCNQQRDSFPVKEQSKKILFVFGGTITTPCIEEVAVPLWIALSRLKKENIAYYKRLKFVFFQSNVLFERKVKEFDLEDVVSIEKPIPERDFYFQLSNADFLVSILADFLKDYITTKNISYLPFRKPIVMISNYGRATEMILENNLGYVLEPKSMFETIIKIVNDFDQNQINFNNDFDIEKFSFPYWAQKISNIIT